MDNRNVFKREYLCMYNLQKTYEELYKEYDRFVKLENDIVAVTGRDLKHIRDLLCAGWTLRAPSSYYTPTIL